MKPVDITINNIKISKDGEAWIEIKDLVSVSVTIPKTILESIPGPDEIEVVKGSRLDKAVKEFILALMEERAFSDGEE